MEIVYKKDIRKDDLKIEIDQESLGIYVNLNGELIPICYWHIDEVEEDSSVMVPMMNAIHLFYTNPQELIDRLDFKFNIL